MTSSLGDSASPTKHGFDKARNFFTIFLMLMACHNVSAMKTDDTNDVSRISYGLNFKFIKEITPISGFWHHSNCT